MTRARRFSGLIKEDLMSKKDTLQKTWDLVAKRLQAGDDHEAILRDLIDNHGALYRRGDPHRLRLAGIVSTCTSSVGGLLHNWKNAASLKLIMANQA